MNQMHIAVFTQLARGHVYPVLPLCTELARRGNRVSYVTNKHFAKSISDAGAEPVLVNPPKMSAEARAQTTVALSLPITDFRSRMMFNSWRSFFFAEALQVLMQVDDFYNNNVPDLILYDRSYVAGRIVSSRLEVPAVQISAHFAFYQGLAMRRHGVCQNPESIIEWSNDLDLFLSQHGLAVRGSYWHVEDLNIHFLPRVFQHNSNWFDDRFCFTGALLNRHIGRNWEVGSDSRQIILISGASLWSDAEIGNESFFKIFLEALRDLPYRCVLSIGEDQFLEELPSNFEINRRASHLEILPHVALAICHGGMTSTLEATYHGVPLLMIPASDVCEEVAYRAEELGIGRCLSRIGLTPERIRTSVTELLNNDDLLSQVRSFQELFIRSGGADLAADRIEQYAKRRMSICKH